MIRFLMTLLTLLACGLPAAAAERLVLPAVDKAAAARDDDARERAGEPYRFALPAEVAVDAAASAAWEDLPGGRCHWQLVVECPGAESLNLGFSRFRLPWVAASRSPGTRTPPRTTPRTVSSGRRSCRETF